MRAYATILCLLLASVQTFAVQPYTPVYPDPVLESWRWRSFPELNGRGLRCFEEDRDGNMWFGVDEGAVRYDGLNWKTYTEADGIHGSPVNQICATRDGSIYFGTDRGISRLSDGEWTRLFPSPDLPSPAQPIPWHIFDLEEATDGSLWAGTPWGALRLNREGATLYTTAEVETALRALTPDLRTFIVPDGAAPARPWGVGVGVGFVGGRSNLWFGNVPFVVWTVSSGSPGDIAGLRVGDRIVAVDGKTDISQSSLAGEAGTEVQLRVQRAGAALPYEVTVSREEVTGAFRSFRIYDVHEGRDGSMWFGLPEGEIVRWDPSGGQTSWRLFTEAGGLDADSQPRILHTRDGTVWAVSAPARSNVNRYDGKTWSHFSLQDHGGFNNNSSVMETRDGVLWIGGNSFIHALREGTWKVYNLGEMSLPTHRVRLLETSDGALWIAGLGQGVARLDYGTPLWQTYQGLVFWCETSDGSQWFLAEDDGIVVHDPMAPSGQAWVRYGVEDGLMDTPSGLLSTRDGALWAFGTHDSTAATARFDPSASSPIHGDGSKVCRWSLKIHSGTSWGVDPWSPYESNDRDIWMGGVRTVLQFDGENWSHYASPEAPPTYGIGQTADGTLWFGGTSGLHRFDGQTWTAVVEPQELSSYVDDVYSTPEGDLWVGSRLYGAFRYDGQEWTQYDDRDGLTGNAVRFILKTQDGTVWVTAGSGQGVNRFDGRTWTTDAVPTELNQAGGFSFLRQSQDGAIWNNSIAGVFAWYYRARPGFSGLSETSSYSLRTVRYAPDGLPPETEITKSFDKVSQPGNTTLAWKGSDPWKATPDGEIQYSYRMNERKWSVFSHRTHEVFETLPSGEHTFEVKARDRDFNEDPTPARVTFTVLPPVWQQGWFIGMVVVFLGGIGFQTSRVVRRDRRLREGNQALSDANKELFQVNVDLQREQVLERLRGQAHGMQSSEDIGPVLEAVNWELTGIGLPLLVTRIVIHLSKEVNEEWITDEEGRAVEPYRRDRRSDSRPELARRSGEAYYHGHIEGERAKERMRQHIASGNPRWKDVPEERWPEKADNYFIFFESGQFVVTSEEPIAEELLMLIKRFGEVFGYAHSRYTELLEKEAQNQELQNQNVLERLRGQAQGMQSSEDIGPVVEAVYRELSGIGLHLLAISIGIHLSDTATEIWLTGEDGRALEPFVVENAIVEMREAQRRGDDHFYRHMEGEELKELGRRLAGTGNPRFVGIPEEQWPTKFEAYSVFFEGGRINLSLEEPLAGEDLMLIKRFGEVFGYAHSRSEELKQKEAQNRRLAVDASVQRLRAEVQSMDEASDFERILSLLTESLKTVELTFDGCGIDVLDEPVEHPTMEYFRDVGFRYTAYRLDPQGAVTAESPHVAAPFPEVIQQTIERFIAGEPWQGTSEGQAIVEVPAGAYGRLRLTASERDSFTDDEIATLREFADAVALGYARYLDIREIQEATERKSAFLASMSHELRTPMNAIKGFTNLVLGRRSENLNDQQRENLGKVSQASDHLLGMIDDLLDLSKIEAGSMDVNPERFNVGELVTSACDTVSPLIQESVELHHDVADGIGEANTDKARLQQMVINLLSNAIKFTDTGSVTVSASQADGQLVIAVSDTGKGIPADELPTIFDEYRQAEGSESSVQKGTGLGLSITKKFAELLGGTIGVESEVGKGSTFTVRVPMAFQEPTS